ncbi:MAG: hypothetical protein ACLUIQ_06610 [Dialister invisus]
MKWLTVSSCSSPIGYSWNPAEAVMPPANNAAAASPAVKTFLKLFILTLSL